MDRTNIYHRASDEYELRKAFESRVKGKEYIRFEDEDVQTGIKDGPEYLFLECQTMNEIIKLLRIAKLLIGMTGSNPFQNLGDLLKPSAPGEDKKWYEMDSDEGHRFLGEVLQLRMRRDILKFIGPDIKTKDEIESTFKLNESVAKVHLDLLEKAMLIEKVAEGYRSTPIGIAYLKNFNDFASETSSESK
jgi:hypothetical protein